VNPGEMTDRQLADAIARLDDVHGVDAMEPWARDRHYAAVDAIMDEILARRAAPEIARERE
jgi:hypothetical protein